MIWKQPDQISPDAVINFICIVIHDTSIRNIGIGKVSVYHIPFEPDLFKYFSSQRLWKEQPGVFSLEEPCYTWSAVKIKIS